MQRIRLRHLALLIVLTFASILIAVVTNSGYLHVNSVGGSTQINGFQTYFESTNQQGKFSIDKDDIRIEAANSTFAEVFVYSSVEDFAWNFSAWPVAAYGPSHPISFSIEWGKSKISVWAKNGEGWHYYSNFGENITRDQSAFGGPVILGSQYRVALNSHLTGSTGNITVTILLSSETWDRTLEFEFPQSFQPAVLDLEAFADNNSYVAVDYNQSVFTSSDVQYTQEATIVRLGSVLVSAVLLSGTIAVSFWRLGDFFKQSKLFLTEKIRKADETLDHAIRTSASYVKKNRSIFCLILLFGSIRMVLAVSTPGHSFDMLSLKIWCQAINDKGLLMIYPTTSILPPLVVRPVYPYPPLTAYILSLVARISPVSSSSVGTLGFLLKLPPILADLALGWITFEAIKSWKGRKPGLLAATLSMVNIVNSSVWGQYDSIVALFMVLAGLAVVKKRVEVGWLFAALAVSTKETALPILPALLLLSVKQRGWRSTMMGLGVFSLALIAVWSPFLLNGYSVNFATWQSGLGLVSSTGAFSSSSEITATSVYALNIWPLISFLKNGVSPLTAFVGGVSDNQPNQFFFLSYFQLGIILFLISYVIVLYRLRKASNVQSMLFGLGLIMLLFYMLPTRMHERYLLFALPFLLLAYKEIRQITISYLLLLVTFSIDLLSALYVDVFNIFATDIGVLCMCSINIAVTILLLYRSFKK